MPDVRLTVNGREYAGWTDVKITRGIEAIAGSFDLSVSEKWDANAEPWPIAEEDECTVSVDGATLITGYVDERGHDYDSDSHSLSVSGRDKTGALVDNSAVLGVWEFLNVPVLDLVTKLAAPFGIAVSLQDGISDGAVSASAGSATSNRPRGGGTPSGVGSAGKTSSARIGKPATKLTINPGDSPFEVIDRACRMVGVLPVSDGLGGLVLTRAGGLRASVALVRGENILSAKAKWGASKRYSRYIVSGQTAGNDDLFGAPAATVKGEATDANVKRTDRVLLIRPEGNVTPAFARQRAAWEATVRAARAASVVITVQGWTQGESGGLWPINALVAVRDPVLGIDGDMLITEAVFGISEKAGTTTALKLAAPNAFIPEPLIIKPASGSDDSFRGILN